MAIPNNILRVHVINAINQINGGRRIPNNRNMRRVACVYENTRYPVKLIISWANAIPNIQELDSNLFTSDEASEYLRDLGFEIVNLNLLP